MSKLKKRAAPILVLAILAMSFLIAPTVQAIEITLTQYYDDGDYTTRDWGDKGDTIAVFGEDVTAGVDINVYWDAVKAWDGEEGLLNTTEADSDGTFEIWFDVPETVVGTHWIWVEDTAEDEFDSWEFTVVPKTSCPSQGLHGDKVDVKGYGFDDEDDVTIIMISSLTPPSTPVTAEVIGTGDGVETDFEDDLNYNPIVPGSVTVNALGVTLTDDGGGDLTGAGGEGDINYVTGNIDIEFDVAPAYGSVSVDYEYYDDVDDQVYVFTTGVDTDEVGSFEKTVTLPDELDMDFGDYWISAYDEDGNQDEDDIKLGAGISVDPDEGPTGTVVDVEGEGFLALANTKIDQGDIVYTDGVNPIDCYIRDAPVDIDNDGDFTLEIVIPSVDDWDDYEDIVIFPGTADEADDGFDTIGDAEIEVSLKFGRPGDPIEIHGYNFSAISDEDVYLELWDEDLTARELTIEDFETDSDGEFSGEFDMPRGEGTYNLVATQDKFNIDTSVSETEVEIKIGRVWITIDEEEESTGAEIEVSGMGFTEFGEWNATLGGIAVFEDENVDEAGMILGTFYVPTMDVGVYDLVVMDVDTGIEVTEVFEVTNTTYLVLDASQAPNEYNVTIEGYYFATIEGGDLEFRLWNATDDWKMKVKQMAGDPDAKVEVNARLNENGNFTAYWKVPDDDILDEGDYTINVTDEEDLWAQIAFTVGPEAKACTPRKDTFLIGDTVAFVIKSSLVQDDSYIKIWDPDGTLYWETDPFDDEEDMWVKIVGAMRTVPYYSQVAGGNPLILLDDAPLGTWTWTWFDEDDDKIESGTFDVAGAPEEVIGARIDELETSISDLSGDITDVMSDLSGVKTDVGSAKAAADAAKAAADSAADAVSDVADTAARAAEAAESAATAAAEATTAAEEAKSAASGLSSLVYGAIGASIVAALAAIAALMQISRRIAG